MHLPTLEGERMKDEAQTWWSKHIIPGVESWLSKHKYDSDGVMHEKGRMDLQIGLLSASLSVVQTYLLQSRTSRYAHTSVRLLT